MNFVFISPNFPTNYWQFIRALNNNGVHVLGIGDCPYEQLNEELKNNLFEYYRVDNMNDYTQMYQAVAYFAYKHGRIDWLESNNEYWLETDAKLREDFNIQTGNHIKQVQGLRYKSKMKAFYEKAGVKTARYALASTYEKGLEFTKLVGYPIIIKPDNGMGAAGTLKVENNEELKYFFEHLYNQHESMIMEEFIEGSLVSFDGIADRNKNIIYCTAHSYPTPVMTILHEQTDCYFYSFPKIPEKLMEAGQATVKAFASASRFFHLEFFILTKDKKGLGKKGDVFGLEVNMRPPGGLAPELFNYAADIDIYQMWADMVVYNKTNITPRNPKYCCCYVARRYSHSYKTSLEKLETKYANNIVNKIEVDRQLSDCMGDLAYIARFNTVKQAQKFIEDMVEDKIICIS